MTSRSHRNPIRPALGAASLALVLAALSAGAAAPGDGAPDAEPEAAKAEAVRTATVGKAKISLHLAPASTKKHAALVAAFQKATAARLAGGEPHVTPRAEPVTLPGGQRMMPLPAELMHTMFVGPTGQSFCSDSTVPAKAQAVNVDGEGR